MFNLVSTTMEDIMNLCTRYRTLTFATEEADDEFRKRIEKSSSEFLRSWVEAMPWSERDKTGIMIGKLGYYCGSVNGHLTDIHAQSITLTYYLHSTKKAFDVVFSSNTITLRDHQHSTLPLDEFVFNVELAL